MNLRSLKKTAKQMDEEKTDMVAPSTEVDAYPWGTRINLDDESLAKLKIGVDDFEIGESVVIMAKGKICSLSSRATEENESQDMSIQITDMSVKPIGGYALLMGMTDDES